MKPDDIFSDFLTTQEEEQFLSTIVHNKQGSKENDSYAVRTSTTSDKTQKLRVCQKNKGQQKPPTDWHSKLLEYGGLLTILFSVFMLISLILRDSGSKIPQAQAAVASVATPEPPKPEICRKKISEIHIGEKSVGHNPKGIEASESDSEIFQKVKHNGYTLLYLKKNQTLSVIELLRPENWLESENIQIRRGSDDKVLEDSEFEQFDLAKEFNRDDEDYDLEVWVELPEMGVVGWATLVAIDDEVKIQDGPGNVVTGTFAHISDNVIDLQIEGQDKPIGCTSNHPFWSADRQEFIEAGQLFDGERVLLYSGETKRVVQKLPRPGPQVVYNLEVYAEHVYHVTQDGVLVHNSCTYSVYVSKNANGTLEYVGRTKNFLKRKANHYNSKGRVVEEVFSGLTYKQARALEHILISKAGLKKSGGMLSNLINGISSKKLKKYQNMINCTFPGMLSC